MKLFFLALSLFLGSIVFSQNIKTETIYKYDIKGQKEIRFKTSEKTYDQNGNKIKEVLFDQNERITKTKTYKYNSSNKLIHETIFDDKDNITKQTIYKYEKDNKVSKIVKDGSGNIKSKKEYSYTFY